MYSRSPTAAVDLLSITGTCKVPGIKHRGMLSDLYEEFR